MLLYSVTRLSVKSAKPHDWQRLDQLFRRAHVKAESVREIAKVALATAGVGGEITERQLAELTGYALSTVRLACRRLVGLKVLAPVPKPRGRGYLKSYRVIWGASRGSFRSNQRNLKKSPDKTLKSLKTYRTQSKDTPAGASGGVQSVRGKASVREKAHDQSPPLKRSPLDYQGEAAYRVKLIMGARFYRGIMRSIRLSLEEWALSEPIRDALEGFYGRRIDGASLSYARSLKEHIWALRSEIERLAASGASPRRVCSFVAGRLAGIPERRSKREVLRRTAELLKNDPLMIERRIAGLRRWLKEREKDYLTGCICSRCGYPHTKIEYQSGYRNDGTGRLNCFGFARLKLEELGELMKNTQRKQRERACRLCGGSLNGGHVNGVCWSCYDSGKNAPRVNGPVMIGDLIVTALKNLDLKPVAREVLRRDYDENESCNRRYHT